MIFTIYEATCEPTYQQRQTLKPVTLRKNVRKHNANLIQAGRPHVRDLISRDCPENLESYTLVAFYFVGACKDQFVLFGLLYLLWVKKTI